jgi:tetratricopeptide (TPR) repeat protein
MTPASKSTLRIASSSRVRWHRCAALLVSLSAAPLAAQAPAPGGAAEPRLEILRDAARLLDREDPVAAWQAYRRATGEYPQDADCLVGLGRAHLMLGRSHQARTYAEAGLRADTAHQDAMALCVRAMIRARAFDDAVTAAATFLLRADEPQPELLAARASALFRVQRTEDAASTYRLVVALDPAHAEAHLRLGSGLLAPAAVTIGAELQDAVAAMRRGDHDRAIAALQALLAQEPRHPVAHRLLGEALFARRSAASMTADEPAFRRLAAALGAPDVRALPVAEFVRGYAALSPARRAVVDRAAALFGRHLARLIAVGGTHDLLLELDRTTDADARSSLRGKRTFDGRVWDDVRGIGGLQAATGIEALDEAAGFGFDTLVHEVAHQVHYFAFSPLQRARIKALYQQALAEDRCLDYYAASNEAEYFGQGVEAFANLGKRPGGETTHGHTRFELFRVDRALHDFVAAAVDFDPLRDPSRRDAVLAAAVAVALRCGRPADAVVAAEMMAAGAERDALLAAARAAAAEARCY